MGGGGPLGVRYWISLGARFRELLVAFSVYSGSLREVLLLSSPKGRIHRESRC